MAKRDVSTGSLNDSGGIPARIIILLLVAALVLGLAKLFSVQNSAPVTVWFYNWKFTSTLADVVLVALCVGAVVMAVVFLSFCLKRRFRKRPVPSGQGHGGPTPGEAGS